MSTISATASRPAILHSATEPTGKRSSRKALRTGLDRSRRTRGRSFLRLLEILKNKACLGVYWCDLRSCNVLQCKNFDSCGLSTPKIVNDLKCPTWCQKVWPRSQFAIKSYFLKNGTVGARPALQISSLSQCLSAREGITKTLHF